MEAIQGLLNFQTTITPKFSNEIVSLKQVQADKLNINKGIQEISQHFDKLNEDLSHFTCSNDICTPIACVVEMVDAIPQDFWKTKDLKILDPCCGNGNFHAYIETKTCKSNLYFNEINPKRIEHVKSYFGNDIQLTQKDFLAFDIAETYDLVVANPPYAKFNDGKRVSKNHNLSRDFIYKALQIVKPEGYLLFIVPNNWMSYSDRNQLPKILSQYQFISLNINGAKKWFPKVGSSFTWFLLQKKPNTSAFAIHNHYVQIEKSEAKLPIGCSFIPLFYNSLVQSIISKTIDNKQLEKYKVETTSYLHHFTKKKYISSVKTDVFKYELMHTPSQVVWSSIPHKYQQGYKVFIALTNQYKTYINTCGMTQSVAFVRCNSKEEALEIKNQLDNEVYVFLNNITRYGNFNNIRVLQNLPFLSLVQLTNDELDFIKSFNKNYYGKKEK